MVALLVLVPILGVPVTIALNGTATIYALAMVGWSALAGIVLILTRDVNGGVRGTFSKLVNGAPPEARGAIEQALERPGMEFKVRTPADAREAVMLNIEGRLFIKVGPGTDRGIVYVGQEKGGTRADRERLQRLVDAALVGPPT